MASSPAYREKNKARLAEQNREYHRNNMSDVRVRKNRNYAKKRATDPEGHAQHLASMREHGRQYRRRVKQEVIAAYGGTCACCGELRFEFLSVDHVDGKGAAERRKTGVQAGYQFYVWLRRKGFPKGPYRLLCFNCNSARGFYGYCPHEREALHHVKDEA